MFDTLLKTGSNSAVDRRRRRNIHLVLDTLEARPLRAAVVATAPVIEVSAARSHYEAPTTAEAPETSDQDHKAGVYVPQARTASWASGTTVAEAQTNATAEEEPDPSSYEPAAPAPADHKYRADFDRALKELMGNKDFEDLYNRTKRNLTFNTKDGTNAQNPDLLGLTEGGTGPGSRQRVSIYLDSTEFRILRDTKSPDYDRLLKEVIVHESIHAYLNQHGKDNALGLWHDPNPNNDKPTDFGKLDDYMNTRFPTMDDELLAHRQKYKGGFLDIDQESQDLIKKIVP